jgi:hypothetical protein
VPLFDKGERAILLVRGNGHADSPLVGWTEGRLRLIEDRVYSNAGREIMLADEVVSFGSRHDFAEIRHHSIGSSGVQINRRSNPNVDDATDGLRMVDDPGTDSNIVPGTASKSMPQKSSQAAGATEFSAWLKRLSSSQTTRSNLIPVLNLDPRAPFSPRTLVPATLKTSNPR